MAGELYRCIYKAIQNGILKEKFTKQDIRECCPGFSDSTYNNYCTKHRIGNPSNVSEQFIQINSNLFSLNKEYIV
ncbi:MAG: hypothetical protein GQ531_10390 [Sulfurovum sp.]|nr:hypothetical protein [Sulfurovum sp.]